MSHRARFRFLVATGVVWAIATQVITGGMSAGDWAFGAGVWVSFGALLWWEASKESRA